VGYESPAIRVLRLPFGQQVHVIGHEAVRKNLYSCERRGPQKLRMHDGDAIRGDEQSMSFVRAESKEVSMKTQVVERLEMLWPASEHVRLTAR
jgi:hypothetical protein